MSWVMVFVAKRAVRVEIPGLHTDADSLRAQIPLLSMRHADSIYSLTHKVYLKDKVQSPVVDMLCTVGELLPIARMTFAGSDPRLRLTTGEVLLSV